MTEKRLSKDEVEKLRKTYKESVDQTPASVVFNKNRELARSQSKINRIQDDKDR